MKSELGIPIPCPSCGGKMKAVSYRAQINLLRSRSWHLCTECNYENSVDDFKKSLLTV